MLYATQNCPIEWSFRSGRRYSEPFRDALVDVEISCPDGTRQTVPAFWAGENVWRVRYASSQLGIHGYRTRSSDTSNADLHGLEGELSVEEYGGDNALFRRGPLRVSASRRHLEHRDGTPFFWLADTWWMALCSRLGWPSDFQRLTSDRVRKGFSVIHLVAGLYPDMPAFDPRGANEAGFPWSEAYGRVNPAYFDMADLRIEWLVRSGVVPCIVACWSYFLPWMGTERMKEHWRYLIARYSAYPVVWCLAGEGAMPYYLSEDKEGDRRRQIEGWTEVAAYVRGIDPHHHPVTIHPTDTSRTQVNDPSLLDFEWLQTGHGDRRSIPNTINLVTAGYDASPRMPVINSEVCYEGIGEQCRQEVQRFMFWACVLSGAAGHSYGANGIWQVNRNGQPYGPSPHGMSWGDTPWDDAARLPGSEQLGLAKRLLERYPWWRFEPHPEWVEPRWSEQDYQRPYAAGIPGEVRILYIPTTSALPLVKGIEPGASYRAFLWNPVDGQEQDLGPVAPDQDGSWRAPLRAAPIFQDWVMVLQRAAA
jgi:hypothetical protein